MGSPVIRYLARHGVEDAQLTWFRENAVRPDVIGVNCYPALSTWTYDVDGKRGLVEAGAGGLAEVMRGYHDRFGLPMAITETARIADVDHRLA